MALSIKHPEADRLARQLAEATGESITDAVLLAIRERLERETGRRRARLVREEVARMQERIGQLPVLDSRSDDEILGYDARGVPEQR